jgi:sulfite reductase (NADPH) flavoprotein alpha-component
MSATSTRYFAYGANLNPRVMHRRGVTPETVQRARLAGYRLVFADVGVPVVEPAFATLELDAASEVHGVVYTFDAASMERLDAYEGGDNERLEVQVTCEGGTDVAAFTYRSRVRREGLRPSRRYLAVLVQGAEERGLDPDWIERLRSEPTAYVPVLSEVVGLSVGAFDWLNRKTGFFDRIFH